MMRSDNVYKVNELLKQLGRLDRINLTFDEHNQCIFRMGQKYDLVLQVDQQYTLLKVAAYIGNKRYQGEQILLENLMMCNFSAAELYGCRIGLCRQTKRYVLSVDLPLALTGDQNLVGVMTNFYQALDWVNQLIESLLKTNKPRQSEGLKRQVIYNRDNR